MHSAGADAISEGFVCEHHGYALLTCFCFGADSSGEVAFLMWTASSPSALSLSTGRVGWCWFSSPAGHWDWDLKEKSERES